MTTPSFQAFIIQRLSKLVEVCDSHAPREKTNKSMDPELINAFIWQTIKDYATAKEKEAFATLEKNHDISKDKAPLGDSILAQSANFTVLAKVSNPVKRFSPEALAELLFKARKIPKHVTIENVDKAKVPTSSNRSVSIVER